MAVRLPRLVGARILKTGLAVTLATGFMSLIDPTHGLVGAGVSAAIMIAPSNQQEKEWARNQFFAALLGAAVGAAAGHFLGDAPWATGLVVMALIILYQKIGYTGAIIGGLSNCLFVLEHTEKGIQYAAFRFLSTVVGLVIGYLVNRYVYPYRPRPAGPEPYQK